MVDNASPRQQTDELQDRELLHVYTEVELLRSRHLISKQEKELFDLRQQCNKLVNLNLHLLHVLHEIKITLNNYSYTPRV